MTPIDPSSIPKHFRDAMERPKTLWSPLVPEPDNYAHDQTNHPRKTPVAERPAGDAALVAAQAQVRAGGRIFVRIESVRKRLLDEDNLVSKYHTDLCRYTGLLPSDAPGVCKIETTQRKAAKGEAEVTEIEITYP